MRPSLRLAGHLGVLLLAARLLVDVATPLLPGAFWLDQSESVVAARASYHIAVNVAAVQPPSTATCASPGPSRSVLQPSEPHVARYLSAAIPRITYGTEPHASTASPDDD
jgi:hypothetical protein